VVGAEQRLAELSKEAESIFALFPGLRGHGFLGGKRGRPKASASEATAPKRRRRKMSKAARKRISDAQKKRWAAQKAEKK
jgi:hypothetical protein